MTLIEKSSNTFVFSGKIQYWTEDIKSVIVDGEKYYKTTRDLTVSSVDEFREKKDGIGFIFSEYFFKEIDYTVFIEDYSTFSFCDFKYSENDYINRILYAFEKGFLSQKVKCVYSDKGNSIYYPANFKTEFDYVLENMRVGFILYKYGFNNFLAYQISVKDLFMMEYKNIPEDVVMMFSRFGIDLKKDSLFQKTIKFMSKKISKHIN